jgi:HEAT repeat protein
MLGSIGPKATTAMKALVPLLLKDKDARVRQEAAAALGYIGSEFGCDLSLIGVSDNEKEMQIARYARALKTAIPPLVEALKDDDEKVCIAAAGALGEIGRKAKPAVPALIRALNDGNEGIRKAAALALGEIGPEAKAAVPALY